MAVTILAVGIKVCFFILPVVNFIMFTWKGVPTFPYCKRRKAGWGLGTRLLPGVKCRCFIKPIRDWGSVELACWKKKKKGRRNKEKTFWPFGDSFGVLPAESDRKWFLWIWYMCVHLCCNSARAIGMKPESWILNIDILYASKMMQPWIHADKPHSAGS